MSSDCLVVSILRYANAKHEVHRISITDFIRLISIADRKTETNDTQTNLFSLSNHQFK